MAESFRPVSNTPPTTFLGKIKFFGRMILDLQILTIYRDIKKTIGSFQGKVLDVGCGQSPYRFLLDPERTTYYGIDVALALEFDYKNANITEFDGKHIPFDDNLFDGLICTEVLEHVYDHQILVNEMFRVMKPGSTGIITVPWSARYHYIPFDFFRYTPSSLKQIFSQFGQATVSARGSDVASVANKMIVIWFRGLFPTSLWKVIFVPFWIIFLPVLAVAVAIAHASLLFGLGSDTDPLGYTVIIRK